MSTQPTHTPGPWHVGMKPGPIIYDEQGQQIADMSRTFLDPQENKTNARLIAAAPDLLAALRELVDLDVCRNMHRAQAAIAKATKH